MPRPTHAPLTDQQVRALTGSQRVVDIRDGELRGLILTVLPSGVKQFTVRYRFEGKQRRHVLGSYPGLSLASARKLARRAQSAIDAGEDPAGDVRAAKATKTDTVEALAAEFL